MQIDKGCMGLAKDGRKKKEKERSNFLTHHLIYYKNLFSSFFGLLAVCENIEDISMINRVISIIHGIYKKRKQSEKELRIKKRMLLKKLH
ncbi:MAG: hypothetical protein ACH350_00660 [Parachlamydiaceae bacterium]